MAEVAFPHVLSLTITNACNLRCRMCGQWGQTGYMKSGDAHAEHLPLSVWRKVIDEWADHGRTFVGLRGGEPFLYPEIIPLLAHIKDRGLDVSIDSNGTLLGRFAEDVARLQIDNINVSVDGPEDVHDRVRGVPGAYSKIREGVRAVREACARKGQASPVRTICFVIGPDSYRSLPDMPDVARELGVSGLAIVPYYYFDDPAGARHEEIMMKEFGCRAASWRGFRRESSGVDPDVFRAAYRDFRSRLGGVQLVPYMDFSEDDYVAWFSDCVTVVGRSNCTNPRMLLDIQPNGDANTCVDFPDFLIGNATRESIEALWNSEQARAFRAYLGKRQLPVCLRCGAKYMSG